MAPCQHHKVKIFSVDELNQLVDISVESGDVNNIYSNFVGGWGFFWIFEFVSCSFIAIEKPTKNKALCVETTGTIRLSVPT